MHKKKLRHRPPVELLESRRMLSVGSAFSTPASPETVTNLNPGWKFALNPSGSPQSTSFNDSSFATVTLPHTYSASNTSPQYGNGWYRKTVTIPSSMSGEEIYLQFLGASLTATVYVDGVQAGTHNGGWEAFDIDVTSEMSTGSHLIAVDTNNNGNSNLVPANGGDYTHQGGLYRSVSLVAVNKTHVALTEPVPAADASGSAVAGSGVYFSNSPVVMGIASATVTTNTILDNLSTSATPVTVTSYLVDAGGTIRAQQTATATLAAGQTDLSVPASTSIASPHLWDGRADPYLYDLYVEVQSTATGQLLDLNHQQVGIRSFSATGSTTATSGFSLNGQPYTLVGVNIHQDSGVTGLNGGPAGWAQTDAQQQSDLDMVVNLGATMVRTSHYQRDPAFYSYCDQKGIIVETEFGLNDNVTQNATFTNNADDMLTELIRQNYDHPSIAVWSLYNEIGNSTYNTNLVASLNSLAHGLDTTGRFTIAESDDGSANDGINTNSDIIAQHPYNGWYSGNPANIASTLASFHSAHPTQPIAANEFGAGASGYQYTTNLTVPIASTTAVYHPQNLQTEIEEEQYASISSVKYLFSDLVWAMFDFTSQGRNEGDAAGINDKGLVTRDRTTYKDLYYFYQANWNSPGSTRGYNTSPVVWISDHNWTDRNGSSTVTVTVFSNSGAPTLTDNGGAPLTTTPQVLDGMTIPDAYTATLALAAGANNLKASASFAGQAYTNAVTWSYHASALAGTVNARVQFTTTASNVQAGYSPDTGGVYQQQASGATYGWTNAAGSPAANTSGTYDRTGVTAAPFNTLNAQTGIILNPGNVWEYQLPNGIYDVHVVGSDSSTSNLVDNLLLNGTTLHATTFNTSGGTFQEFYETVDVTNGLLTLTGGPGMVLSSSGVPTTQGRLSYIDINTIDNTAPTVSSVVVNDGQAQRSMIDNLSVVFQKPVVLQSGAATLEALDGNGNLITTYALSAANPSGDGQTYVLTLSSGANLDTLSDGIYKLMIDPTKVADTSGLAMQSSYSFEFFRLFGDSNGDGYVNGLDLLQFRKAYTGGPSAYNSIFDYNQDGTINGVDFSAFTQRLGTHIIL